MQKSIIPGWLFVISFCGVAVYTAKRYNYHA